MAMTGEKSWRGMTFGEFNAMLAQREEPIPAFPVDLGCVHPFNILGISWRVRRTPLHLMVTLEYRCLDCGALVASSFRDLRR
jgi:hypothetical protein